MSISILAANVLTLVAFIIHTIVGDHELMVLSPDATSDPKHLKTEKWTMARNGWHWVSFDLLFTSVALALINFTDYLQGERFLLQVLAVYFFCNGIVWLTVITISKSFPQNYFKLGQWILLWLISGLIFWGLN
jgi:hypothetical protein